MQNHLLAQVTNGFALEQSTVEFHDVQINK